MIRFFAICASLACLAFALHSGTRIAAQEKAAADFYAAALAQAHSTETVRIGGREITIANGTASVRYPFERNEALRVGYALMLARRAPLFGLPDVDPQALRSAAVDLQKAAHALGAEQSSARDAAAVSARLYPFDFLQSLANLEADRQRFIASGSDLDENRYETALRRTLYTETKDAAQFSQAFTQETASSSTMRIPTLGGTLTEPALAASLQTLATFLQSAKAALSAQEECLDGRIVSCQPDALALTPPAQLPQGGSASRTDLRDAGANTYVILSQSACLSQEPAPYVFLYDNSKGPDGRSRMPILYAGELYFTPTNESAPTLAYLRETLGITYSLVNPLEFYQCPDVERDLGAVFAVLATARFAQAHPAYAPSARARLLSTGMYTDADAAEYLRAAVAEIGSAHLAENDATLADLENLLIAWKNPSGGLPELVSAIAAVDETDARVHAQSVPFSVDAPSLFLTHSAFPSLFLPPLASSTPLLVRQTTGDDTKHLFEHLVTLRALEKFVPRAEIIRNINAYLTFEGIETPWTL